MKTKQVTYKSNFYRWANSMPGKPLIHVEKSSEFDGYVIYYHRQHRRIMKHSYLNSIKPNNIIVSFKQVSHKKIKDFKEKENKPSYYDYNDALDYTWYRGIGWY